MIIIASVAAAATATIFVGMVAITADTYNE